MYLRRKILARTSALVAILFAWEVAAWWIDKPRLLPSINRVGIESLPSFGIFSDAGEGGYAAASSVLIKNACLTIVRIAAGLSVGLPVGLVLGLATYFASGGAGGLTLPLLVLRSIPLLALIPLFSFWFGDSPEGVVAYIAFGVSVVVASDSFEAAQNVSPNHVKLGFLLGGSRVFVIRTVYVPSIRGSLAGSLRNLAGLTWAFSLGAEYLASSNGGLGGLAYRAYLYSDNGKLIVLCLVYIALGYGSFRVSETILGRAGTERALSAEQGEEL